MRKKAIPPEIYTGKDNNLLYPKDADAGGSWIAMSDNGNAAVLLNGAFVKHVPLPPYQRSRGLVFTHIIADPMPVRCLMRLELTRIEPFTIVILEQDSLYECRWDGSKKHCRQLPNYRPYIWSSVTLYSEDIIQKRERWFASWLNRNPNPVRADILHFHQFAGEGDTMNDLRMNRHDSMLTVSITSMQLVPGKGIIAYMDLGENKQYKQELDFIRELTTQ